MKRVFKNPIVMFVLGALIFSSISVYAARKYYASDIEYKETTLDKALDTLYTKTKTYKNLTETTNVEANTLLSGKKAYKSDGSLVNGSIQTYSDAINVTPSNAQQVLQTAGKYMNSNITVGTVPSSYKDTSLATVTNANQIFTGLKAYLKDGTLVTGTGGKSISGSHTWTQSDVTNGIKICDFTPSSFVIGGIQNNGTKYVYYYNSNFNSKGFYVIYIADIVNTDSYVKYRQFSETTSFSINNGLKLKWDQQNWLGQTIDYMITK